MDFPQVGSLFCSCLAAMTVEVCFLFVGQAVGGICPRFADCRFHAEQMKNRAHQVPHLTLDLGWVFGEGSSRTVAASPLMKHGWCRSRKDASRHLFLRSKSTWTRVGGCSSLLCDQMFDPFRTWGGKTRSLIQRGRFLSQTENPGAAPLSLLQLFWRSRHDATQGSYPLLLHQECPCPAALSVLSFSN